MNMGEFSVLPEYNPFYKEEKTKKQEEEEWMYEKRMF